MKRTLLLCFIHGFKGDDNTFGSFPEHLRAVVSHALPKIDVAAITYPTFETRGDLKECVGRFREWGIVAAETLLAIAADQPLAQSAETHAFLFPYIQGVLAFDTPYLGISPGVVAYGAEGHYKTASSTFEQLSGLAGGMGLWGTGASKAGEERGNEIKNSARSGPSADNGKPQLPSPRSPSAEKSEVDSDPASAATAAASSAAAVQKDTDAAATPAWQRWGKVAMFAGAAGAVAAGGAAAYMKRDRITEGWGWVGSHLEFVGCLMRAEELKRRFEGVAELREERSIGFGVLFTRLGRGAGKGSAIVGGVASGALGNAAIAERTFCSLPREKSGWRSLWWAAVNDMASDELVAHMNMFYPKSNPGYYAMSEKAKGLIVEWAGGTDWYEMSSERIGAEAEPPQSSPVSPWAEAPHDEDDEMMK
ncbi:MAG: Chitin synthase, class 7 [Chaenotheca gracillima]|nr:MAG: Chitin synthase, class 7 [Chaenotheca gracillima]